MPNVILEDPVKHQIAFQYDYLMEIRTPAKHAQSMQVHNLKNV